MKFGGEPPAQQRIPRRIMAPTAVAGDGWPAWHPGCPPARLRTASGAAHSPATIRASRPTISGRTTKACIAPLQRAFRGVSVTTIRLKSRRECAVTGGGQAGQLAANWLPNRQCPWRRRPGECGKIRAAGGRGRRVDRKRHLGGARAADPIMAVRGSTGRPSMWSPAGLPCRLHKYGCRDAAASGLGSLPGGGARPRSCPRCVRGQRAQGRACVRLAARRRKSGHPWRRLARAPAKGCAWRWLRSVFAAPRRHRRRTLA